MRLYALVLCLADGRAKTAARMLIAVAAKYRYAPAAASTFPYRRTTRQAL
jgi:hypothetical protein